MHDIAIHNTDGKLTVSSLQLAKDFEKQHKHVLDKIADITKEINSAEKSAQYFIESTYTDNSGKKNKCYEITRDGFSLLAMGFTGKKALEWKLNYIEAFNKMLQYCQSDNPALLQYVQSLESRIATLESKQTKTRKALPEEEPTDEIKLVLTFIDECCMKRVNGYNKDGITTRVLYDYFVKWCYQEKNVTPPTKTDFVKGVCNFFDVSYKNKNKIRRKTSEQRYYIITLRPEYINK